MPNSTYPTEQVPAPKKIIVFVCPTAGCPNYYGTEGFEPGSAIEQPQRRRNQNNGEEYDGPARIECPDCRINGIKVNRVPYVVTTVIPFTEVMSAYRAMEERAAKERENAQAAEVS